jgi:hypothetical protein
MSIQALTITVNLLANVPASAEETITKQFENECVTIVNTLPYSTFVITAETMERAINLVEYFNMHKLVLSSYDINPKGSFREAFERITRINEKKILRQPTILIQDKKVLGAMKQVFKIKRSISDAQSLTYNNYKAVTVTAAYDALEEMRLGKCYRIKPLSGAPTYSFLRISSHELLINPQIGDSIISLGLNLPEVVELLKETEQYESSLIAPEIRKLYSKRKRESSGEVNGPLAKKHKSGESESAVRVAGDDRREYVFTEDLIMRLGEQFSNLRGMPINDDRDTVTSNDQLDNTESDTSNNEAMESFSPDRSLVQPVNVFQTLRKSLARNNQTNHAVVNSQRPFCSKSLANSTETPEKARRNLLNEFEPNSDDEIPNTNRSSGISQPNQNESVTANASTNVPIISPNKNTANNESTSVNVEQLPSKSATASMSIANMAFITTGSKELVMQSQPSPSQSQASPLLHSLSQPAPSDHIGTSDAAKKARRNYVKSGKFTAEAKAQKKSVREALKNTTNATGKASVEISSDGLSKENQCAQNHLNIGSSGVNVSNKVTDSMCTAFNLAKKSSTSGNLI